MQLTQLNLGDTWKVKNDTFTIISHQHNSKICYLANASGTLHCTTTENFRDLIQDLVSTSRYVQPYAPQRYQEHDVVYHPETDTNYIIVRNVRSKMVGLDICSDMENPNILKLGDIQKAKDSVVVSNATPFTFVGGTVISSGMVWKVLDVTNTYARCISLDDNQVRNIDWKLLGDARWAENDDEVFRSLVLMSAPQPDYGQLNAWRQFMRVKDRIAG